MLVRIKWNSHQTTPLPGLLLVIREQHKCPPHFFRVGESMQAELHCLRYDVVGCEMYICGDTVCPFFRVDVPSNPKAAYQAGHGYKLQKP